MGSAQRSRPAQALRSVAPGGRAFGVDRLRERINSAAGRGGQANGDPGSYRRLAAGREVVWSDLVRVLGIAYAGALTLVVLVWLAARALGRPFSYLSAEPSAALGQAWYAGFLSNVGVLLWTVAASVALLTWWTRRSHADRGANIFLWVGLLTAAELLDDLFLLHDAFYPMLGVPEQVVTAVYGAATVALAGVYRERLGGAGLAAFGLTLALFVGAVSLDGAGHADQFLEDSLKFLGIATWTSYLVVICVRELRASVLGTPCRHDDDDALR